MKTKSLALLLTAVHLHFAAPARAGGDYVAHEWGTFTSLQGADGVQFEWNPQVSTDLPSFVYNAARPGGGSGKVAGSPDLKRQLVLQRMETPVIYFYADQEMTVDVAVNFPAGLVTEWYPQIQPPPALKVGNQGLRAIEWNQVRLFPNRLHAAMKTQLPGDGSGSHYFAARETDADFLRVAVPGKAAPAGEIEQFLFYRGVASFAAPLTVTQSGDGEQLTLQNTGAEELRHLFIYALHDGQGKFVAIDKLAPRSSRAVQFNREQGLQPLSDLRAAIAKAMEGGLTREGLYEREAAAMVKTWDDSWFAESGVRVLYTLPRAWTDRVLPLKLNPAPRDVVRVMVGRAELITPAMDWQLTRQVVRFADGHDRAGAAAEVRKLGLGRFLESAMRRLTTRMHSREFGQAATELLAAATASTPVNGKPFAAR